MFCVRSVVTALACCFLLAGTSGCQFHRTGHGFIMESRRWTLELDTTDPTSRHNQANNTADSSDSAEHKPEILKWRAFSKNHRLGDRLFHRDEDNDAASKYPDERVSTEPESAEPSDTGIHMPEIPQSEPSVPVAKPKDTAQLEVAPTPSDIAMPDKVTIASR